MINPQLDLEMHRARTVIDWLLKDNADSIDEQTLQDTIEGQTDLHEVLAKIARGARNDEKQIARLKSDIDELKERIENYERRREHRRQVILNAMLEFNIKTIRAHDMTMSTRDGVLTAKVIDETKIPNDYFKTVKVLLKQKLNEAVINGTPVDGAVLNNPGPVLNVRTR